MGTLGVENIHKGRQAKRFRESIGMKQSALADELKTSQQNISNWEQQEDLPDQIFDSLAKGMGVTPDALKRFNPESSIFQIQEMKDNSQAIYNFNPIDKLLEVMEENKKLYERLLESERDKVELLKREKKS